MLESLFFYWLDPLKVFGFELWGKTINRHDRGHLAIALLIDFIPTIICVYIGTRPIGKKKHMLKIFVLFGLIILAGSIALWYVPFFEPYLKWWPMICSFSIFWLIGCAIVYDPHKGQEKKE